MESSGDLGGALIGAFKIIGYIYDSLLNFFKFITAYLQSLIEGGAYVAEFLIKAPLEIGKYTTLLPTEINGALIVLLGILVSLATVRWIT